MKRRLTRWLADHPRRSFWIVYVTLLSAITAACVVAWLLQPALGRA